jgi:hypothetical protein
VKKRDNTLIDEIERGALDSGTPISDTLRKLIALGGQAGSADLREWAGLELNGYYKTDVPLPEYRKAGAVIKIDGATFNAMISGQQISPRNLPDVVREHVGEEVPLNQPIREIETMIERAKASEGELKLALPSSQDVVAMMSYERGNDPYSQVTAIYWSASQVALEGVLDRIRTTLVGLVAEMRAAMPESASTPSADVADQAVNVVVKGGKRHKITVATSQVAGSGAPDVQTTTDADSEDASMWRRLGAVVAGLAAVVGTAVAIATWQGWNPF